MTQGQFRWQTILCVGIAAASIVTPIDAQRRFACHGRVPQVHSAGLVLTDRAARA
jgi:hypothetical protein